MSQMPDIAGSWPDEGTQYVPGAPMDPAQQGYPPQQYAQQQPYPPQQQYPQQQGYQDPQYAQQQYQQQYQQQGYQEQGYQEQGYPDQTPQQPFVTEEEQASVPSEFDHLFRDSQPENRKSISGRQPVVSGPGAAPAPAFQQQQQQQQQQAPTQVAQAPVPMRQPFEDRVPTEYQPLQQPFGGGYGTPGGPGSGGGAGERRTPLIIGGVVVAIAAVGLYLGLSGGGGGGAKPSAGPSATTATQASNQTAQQQAAAVYQLVQQSKELRSDINAEVGGLVSCSNISALQSEITNTAQARQTQANKVATLDVSKISGGSSLISALHSAWSDSAASDADYAKAAGDFASGSCSKSAVKADGNYQSAVQGSDHVTSEKADAVDQWNSTMTNYGQPKIAQTDL